MCGSSSSSSSIHFLHRKFFYTWNIKKLHVLASSVPITIYKIQGPDGRMIYMIAYPVAFRTLPHIMIQGL
jgi:hypothetical protein